MSNELEHASEIGDEAEKIKIKITPRTIERAFRSFGETVFKEKKDKLTPNERANLFVQLITNPQENYPHPKKRDTLITKAFGDIRIDSKQFRSFFEHFEGQNYTPREKEALTSSIDRIVEDTTRRSKGEFFTPTEFVDLAHSYITEQFGDDWKERFVVWDPAAGTLNLTRDYKFRELYCSTLEESDLETASQHGYNPDAVKFQYDFLNDGPEKLPQGLRDAIDSGKEILFLINPPYAMASGGKGGSGGIEKGIQNTAVRDKMIKEGWGKASSNLYAQFMARVWYTQASGGNVHLALFCDPGYLTAPSYRNFRDKFFDKFKFDKGFVFRASHFSGVSSAWGINFAMFSPGRANEKYEFIHDIVDSNGVFLESNGRKALYNTDGLVSLKEWSSVADMKRPTDFPKMTSSLKAKETKHGFGIPENSFGTLVNNGNNVSKNMTEVLILSGGFTGNMGRIFIDKSSFGKSCVVFAARKLIAGNWINDKDEYLAPNENHPEFDQFYYDSIVYSLFNNSSEQSSLRQIDYKGKKWDIKNEFFWMSREKILELAEEHNFDELYRDSKFDKDRYVHTLLFGPERLYDKLSPDAREVLDLATELTTSSITLRKIVSEEHPEYHLDAWDAGYSQLKRVWRDYLADDFKAFRDKYNALGERMRPLVYELGFLLR